MGSIERRARDLSSKIVGVRVVLEYCKYTVLSPPLGNNVFRTDVTIDFRDPGSMARENDESRIIPATKFAISSIPAGVETCSSDNRTRIRSAGISVKSTNWDFVTTTFDAPESRS